MNPARRAPPVVFFDKDGTLLEDVGYNADPARMVLLRGAGAALALLAAAGFRLMVVSNQPGVALGYFDEAALAAVRRRLADMFSASGARLDAFYYCPHHPAARRIAYRAHCACRKPLPGMLERAAREHGVDLRSAWLVGDILDDVEAGRRAGCNTILLDHGNETVWRMNAWRRPDYMVADPLAAAATILTVTGTARRGVAQVAGPAVPCA